MRPASVEAVDKEVDSPQRKGRVCAGNPRRVSCAIEILSFQNFYKVLKTGSAGRKDFFDTLSRGRTHKRPASVISVGLPLKHAVPVGVLSEQRRRFGDGSLPVGGTADQEPSRVRVKGSGGGMVRRVGDLHDQPRKV